MTDEIRDDDRDAGAGDAAIEARHGSIADDESAPAEHVPDGHSGGPVRTNGARPGHGTAPAEPAPAEPAPAPPAEPATEAEPATAATATPTRPPQPEGFPRPLWALLDKIPVPPPMNPRTWRSPLRGPWLTSVFGALLLVGLPVVILTGLLSYIAYQPQYGQAIPADVGLLHLPVFDWPTSPAWIYRLSQGLHVGLGFVLLPVVLVKLWSVIPKLFAWPPVRSLAQLLERLSLLMLVGGVLFEFATGIMNNQYDYSFGFSFYTGHYYGAWVFITGFVVHVAIKLPTMVRSLRRGPYGTGAFHRWLHDTDETTEPEPLDAGGLVAEAPSRASLSRRALLATVGAGSALVALFTVGQTVDGLRPLALLSPRGRSYGDGPNDFQINRTAMGAGIPTDLATHYQLRLTGGARPVALTRTQLAGMRQHTATLPIACVEGWSVTRTWTGVPLRDLAALAGVPRPHSAFVQSIETSGAFAHATLNGGQAMHPDSLLALEVDGAALSLDHGFPARVIAPGVPGVHNTKWVGSIDFRAGGL